MGLEPFVEAASWWHVFPVDVAFAAAKNVSLKLSLESTKIDDDNQVSLCPYPPSQSTKTFHIPPPWSHSYHTICHTLTPLIAPVILIEDNLDNDASINNSAPSLWMHYPASTALLAQFSKAPPPSLLVPRPAFLLPTDIAT